MFLRVVEIVDNQVQDKGNKILSLDGRSRVTIGRDPSCDVVIGLSIHPEHRKSISRVQATVLIRGDRFFIIDGSPQKSSGSGILVDGYPLQEREEKEITVDSKIMLFATATMRIEVCLNENNGNQTLAQNGTYPGEVGEALAALWVEVGKVQELVHDLNAHRSKMQEFDAHAAAQLNENNRQMQQFAKRLRWLSVGFAVVAVMYVIQATGTLSEEKQEKWLEVVTNIALSAVALGGAAGVAVIRKPAEESSREEEPTTRSLPPTGQ